MRNPLTVAFAKNIVEATITEADLVTPAMRRIRLEPDVPIPHVPGQHIRIEVNDPLSPRGLLRPLKTLRTYSVWAYDTKAIDMLAHLYDHDGGGGIGLRWAPGARPGDRSPQHDLPMPHRTGLRRVHRHGASAHRSETCSPPWTCPPSPVPHTSRGRPEPARWPATIWCASPAGPAPPSA